MSFQAENTHTSDRLKRLLLDLELFDENYYISNYKEELRNNIYPIDHFCQEGIDTGLKPSAVFDPLLLKICNTNIKTKEDFVSLLESNGFALSETYNFISLFPEVASAVNVMRHNYPLKEQAASNRANSNNYSKTKCQELKVAETKYKLNTVPIDFFLDKVKNNTPFTYIKLPHGYFEGLARVKIAQEMLSSKEETKHLNTAELERLAVRLCAETKAAIGLYSENVCQDLRKTHEYNNDKTNFYRSFGVKGHPTIETEETFPAEDDRKREIIESIIKEHFSPEEFLICSMVFKSWAISGDIKRFPETVREHPVILIGADYLSDLGERWKLTSFQHIKIPLRKSQEQRFDLLKRTISTIDKTNSSDKRPIVIAQCGGSLAYWLFYKLHGYNSNVFYIDIGQSVNTWFLDKIPLKMGWLRVYAGNIVENCGLEDFYKDKMDDFEAWKSKYPTSGNFVI